MEVQHHKVLGKIRYGTLYYPELLVVVIVYQKARLWPKQDFGQVTLSVRHGHIESRVGWRKACSSCAPRRNVKTTVASRPHQSDANDEHDCACAEDITQPFATKGGKQHGIQVVER